MTSNIIKQYALIFLLFIAGNSYATDLLSVSDAWIRQPPPHARVVAAYLTISNDSSENLAVTDISSPDFGSSMIHATIEEDGMMKMIHQDKLDIPAHGQVELKPGGMHVMLFDPKQALAKGTEVTLELHLANGTIQRVKAPVKRH